MTLFSIKLTDYDDYTLTIGYATTEEKAKKMIEFMNETDGYESYDYTYSEVYVDTLFVNGDKIQF